MFDEDHLGGPAEHGATDTSSGAGRVPLQPATPATDPLPLLIADAEPAALGRTVLAVAAMHEPDERGRCRVCWSRWRWRRASRRESWCSTRRVLWATLVGSHVPGSR